MPHEVRMPQLGMVQDSGVIVAWLKRNGDPVRAGDPVFEVETDKATMEVEAAADGYLSGVTAAEGDDVPVGGLIAMIVEDEGDVEAAGTGASVAEPVPAPGAHAVSRPDPGPERQETPAPAERAMPEPVAAGRSSPRPRHAGWRPSGESTCTCSARRGLPNPSTWRIWTRPLRSAAILHCRRSSTRRLSTSFWTAQGQPTGHGFSPRSRQAHGAPRLMPLRCRWR